MSNVGLKGFPNFMINSEKGFFLISGMSFPEDAIEAYKSLLDSLKEYCLKPQPLTTIEFELEYCNSSTIKVLMNLFIMLQDMIETNQVEVIVKWHCEEANEDDCELAEDLQELSDLPFHIIKS